MIAIGVGCRKGCATDDIVALVLDALSRLPNAPIASGLFSIEEKRGEAGLVAAAAALGLPLVLLSRANLQRAAGEARTRSKRVEALYGLPSVAETAALAGAGPGAILLVARLANQTATCAIAGTAPERGRSVTPVGERPA